MTDSGPSLSSSSLSSHSIRCPAIYRDGVVVGIDEAGRGPVVGPLVYAAAMCPTSLYTSGWLKTFGFADSKALTAAERQRLLAVINSLEEVQYLIDSISAEEISSSMLAKSRMSLNEISHSSAITIVRVILSASIPITSLIVDTVGDPQRYQQKLSQIFPQIGDIRVEKKADANHPIVSAASIVAKTHRDKEVEEMVNYGKRNRGGERVLWVDSDDDEVVHEEGKVENISTKEEPSKKRKVDVPPSILSAVEDEIGSGCNITIHHQHPGDPLTKSWLQRHFDPLFGFPPIVRFSWSTAKKFINERGMDIEWGDVNYNEDEDEEGGGNSLAAAAAGTFKLESFFDRISKPKAAPHLAKQESSSSSSSTSSSDLAAPPPPNPYPRAKLELQNAQRDAVRESSIIKRFSFYKQNLIGYDWDQQWREKERENKRNIKRLDATADEDDEDGIEGNF